jgi:hypothetical protein
VADPEEHIEAWRRAGLIDEALAARLLQHEKAAAHPALPPAADEDDRPGIIEALLYLGLTIAGAGVFFLVAQQWDELRSWSRVMLIAVPALLSFVAGAAMLTSGEPGVRRGGHVAWMLTVALIAGTLAVGFNEFATDEGLDDERWMVLAVATVTAVAALILWAVAPSNPQVLAVAGSAVFFGEALGAWPDDYTQRLAGCAIAIAGVLLMAATEASIFRPRALARATSAVLVGGGAFHAGIESAIAWEALAFIAGVALIVAGVWRRSFTYVAAGTGTLLVALITFMFEHFEDRISAPLALMLSGGLVVAAVLILVQVRGIVRARRATA